MIFFAIVFLPAILSIRQYRIGGLFDDINHNFAFGLITYKLNSQNMDSNVQLIEEPFNASYYNIFEARIGVCKLLKKGVVAVFGPSSSYTSTYIQSVCDHNEIPQIETHMDLKQERTNCLVNLYPHPSALYTFFVDLINYYDWHTVIVLYEDNESLLRLVPLLDLNNHQGRNVILKELELDGDETYRTILNEVKYTGETKIVLECSVKILETVLIQAQQVGIMNEKYSYIITSVDFQTINLKPFKYAGTNITGIQMMNTKKVHESFYPIKTEWKLTFETALLMDGVELLYETLHNLTLRNKKVISSQPLKCQTPDFWRYGLTIINHMKNAVFPGKTGVIKFDKEGFRRDFKLDIVHLTKKGLIKTGEWNSTTRTITSIPIEIEETGPAPELKLFNKTFTIITCLTQPYSMLIETTKLLTGNDRFEGFCIDVIKDLAKIVGFNYTFTIQEDGSNGNYNRTTKQWNGVIREILDGRADLAITDLTITSERENVVDFTMPFMNLGISILYKKPKPVPPSLFMFASPFSTMVWVTLGLSYFLVSFAVFIMGRLSISEWTNPYPCIEEPEYLINQFSIRNSLWFTIGALMQQGSELAPISISTRTASGVWWFFVLIMVSTYTANLAAFLTVETRVTPFKNIDELANQDKIKFGCKSGGATENFFRDSNVSTYRKVYEYLKNHPEVMTADNDEGVKRAESRTENYAYLMESTTIQYVTERRCALAQVGELLDDKGYGIAMKKESVYRNDLSTAVLKLQETGRLDELKTKWWKEKRGGGSCAFKSEQGEATPLDLKNVGGVFLVLYVGAILGFFGSFIELSLYVYRRCKTSRLPFKEEIKKELSFFIKFKKNIKLVDNTTDIGDDNVRL